MCKKKTKFLMKNQNKINFSGVWIKKQNENKQKKLMNDVNLKCKNIKLTNVVETTFHSFLRMKSIWEIGIAK